MRQRIENCVRNFLTRRSLTEMKVWYDNKSECFFGYCWNMFSRFGFGINERSLNSNYFTSCRSYSSRFNGSLIRDLIDLLRMKISIIRRVWLLLLNRKMGDSSKLMGAAAAILAAFLALAGAAWSLDLPDVLCFNLFMAIYWIFLYLSIYIEIRWWVYERTKEWIKISSRFKSLQYFFILFSVYTALALIPSDLFIDKMKVILILGGSAALFYVGLASTPFEKELSVNILFLSSISAATLLNIAGPTEVFLSILIFLLGLFFLPFDFLFFVVIMVRLFIFDDYGPALFVQTSFVYGLRKWRKKTRLLGAIYITILFCIWLVPGMLKGILFPLSGALAIFFFFVATCGKEHTLAALFYLLNQLYLCFVTQNKDAAIYLLYIHAGFFLIFTLLTFLKRINDRDNDRKVSKFRDDFLFLLLDGKKRFFLVFFGPIFQLVSGAEQWVRALAGTLFLQVLFLNILIFLFQSLTKEIEGGNSPDRKENEGGANYVRLDPPGT